MAKVFIGIPTLNRPAMVLEAIDSVRRQTFSDYRVVVSDNCSNGNVAETVRSYVEGLADPRFSFFQQPRNVGEYGQGRYFLEKSAGHDYLMILHDDDRLAPDYLDAGVQALDTHRVASFFVANSHAMDQTGKRWPAQTARAMRSSGRTGAKEGLIDVLSSHVMHGFTPITATLFRRQALEASGYVDSDCQGNYPFEANIFLRLGEIGAKAWFSARELLDIRYHSNSLRNHYLLHDPQVVRTCLRIWERRRFSGVLERRRRSLVSRYHRADALIKLREGNLPGARASLVAALRANPHSVRLWGLAPLLTLAPRLLRALIVPLPVHANPPHILSASSHDAPEPRS